MNHIGRPLIRLESVTSTMDVARALMTQNATFGTAVLAGYQSQGRGRSKRAWESPPWSSILLSFLTSTNRPVSEIGVLSLLWGWAVAETVESITGQVATIKWPNDVLVNDRKISGVLVTNSPLRGQDWQITGIGLNVTTAEHALPTTAISLAMLKDQPPALDEVLQELLSNLNRAWEMFDCEHDNFVTRLITPRLAMRGELVTIIDGNRELTGTVSGLDPTGELLLTDPLGAEIRVVAGEVTRGPRRS